MPNAKPPSTPEVPDPPPSDISSPGWGRREISWSRSPWLFGLLIVLAVFAVYANSLQGEWIYDDHADILGNQAIQKLWPLKDHFIHVVNGQSGLHPRPLGSLSFTLNFLIGQNNPLIFHSTNVSIHILATLFLFGLLRRTLPLLNSPSFSPSADLLALFIALLWGLHPLQTEAVAYITQRYESLMGLFVFLTLYCVLRSSLSRHPSIWGAATALSCLLALASKEVAVSLPLLVLLYDRTFLAGSFRTAWHRRRALYLSFGVVLALFAWNQSLVVGRPFAGFELPWSWWQYAMNQPSVILHYLRLVVWPHPLVLDYLWYPATSILVLIPGFLVVGAMFAATVIALTQNSWLGFLGAFFFLILAPTSSIMPILDLAVEHRMYLPLAPVLICLFIGAYAFANRFISGNPALASHMRMVTLICVTSVLTIFGCLTVLRSDDYRNSLSIWQDTVAKRPNNARAHSNYAHALHQAGNLDEAIAQIKLAVMLAPYNATMRLNHGVFLEQKGQHEQALQELEYATQLDPTDARPWINLGLIHASHMNLGKADECMRRALVLDPRSAQAHLALGDLFGMKGHDQEAMDHYREALRLQPGFSLPHRGLANLLIRQGHVQEACKEFDIYIDLDAKPAKAAGLAAHALLKHGNVSEAFRYWHQAIHGDPTDVSTMLLMSWILATHPQTAFRNGTEALALAEAALRARGQRTPANLEALGTAYAELGRFTEACAVTEDAITKLKANPSIDRTKIESRLALFKRGQPYREDPAEDSP